MKGSRKEPKQRGERWCWHLRGGPLELVGGLWSSPGSSFSWKGHLSIPKAGMEEQRQGERAIVGKRGPLQGRTRLQPKGRRWNWCPSTPCKHLGCEILHQIPFTPSRMWLGSAVPGPGLLGHGFLAQSSGFKALWRRN